jgi:hypothetical protein
MGEHPTNIGLPLAQPVPVNHKATSVEPYQQVCETQAQAYAEVRWK